MSNEHNPYLDPYLGEGASLEVFKAAVEKFSRLTPEERAAFLRTRLQEAERFKVHLSPEERAAAKERGMTEIDLAKEKLAQLEAEQQPHELDDDEHLKARRKPAY